MGHKQGYSAAQHETMESFDLNIARDVTILTSEGQAWGAVRSLGTGSSRELGVMFADAREAEPSSSGWQRRAPWSG